MKKMFSSLPVIHHHKSRTVEKHKICWWAKFLTLTLVRENQIRIGLFHFLISFSTRATVYLSFFPPPHFHCLSCLFSSEEERPPRHFSQVSNCLNNKRTLVGNYFICPVQMAFSPINGNNGLEKKKLRGKVVFPMLQRDMSGTTNANDNTFLSCHHHYLDVHRI